MKRKITLRNRRKSRLAEPLYAYKPNGKLEGAYPSRVAFARKHRVLPASVNKALWRKGSCAGLRLRRLEAPSLLPIIKKDYPLFPSFAIYRYDRKGNLQGKIMRKEWTRFPKQFRVSLLGTFHQKKTHRLGLNYYSLLKGPQAFTSHAMQGNEGETKGRVLVIFPSGRRHYYPRAAEAARDLRLSRFHVSHYAGGRRKPPKGYTIRYE